MVAGVLSSIFAAVCREIRSGRSRRRSIDFGPRNDKRPNNRLICRRLGRSPGRILRVSCVCDQFYTLLTDAQERGWRRKGNLHFQLLAHRELSGLRVTLVGGG